MPLIEKMLNMPPHFLNPWFYWIILLVSLLEPLPIIGSFIPGQTLVLLGGFLVKKDILDFGDLVAFAAVGAVLGDLVGYLIGRRYGDGFLTKYGKHFFLKKERLEKVKALLHKYTGRTLVLGRFNSITRCFSPFLAGSSGVPFWKFLSYNIIGGLSWSLAFASIGFVFGKGFEIASRFIGQFIIMALVLSGIIIFLIKLRNGGRRVFHESHRSVLILNVVSLYLFSKMIEDVVHGQSITAWDAWISGRMPLLWGSIADSVMNRIATTLSPLHLEISALMILAFLIFKRRSYRSFLLFTGMGGGLAISRFVGYFVRRPMPYPQWAEGSRGGFPSPHASAGALFFCLMIFLFKDDIAQTPLKVLFILGNVFLFLLLGFSGIYLNVSWFSNVVGGISLGLFWPTLMVLFLKNFIPGFKE